MLARYHYHGLIKKYISMFGTLFNSIVIRRKNSSGNFVENMKVPLSYGPKPKFLTRIRGDEDFNKKVGVVLPRMGFDIQSFTYDPNRKLNSHNKQFAFRNDEVGSVMSPVPYDIGFGLYIFAKYAEDGSQIIEQILPAFKPELTITLNALPTMGIKLDVPIILNNVSFEDSYEGDYNTRRSIIWTLDFTLKGVIYPNISGKGFGDGYDEASNVLIRTALTNFHIIGAEQTSVKNDSILLEDSDEFTSNYLINEIEEDKVLYESTEIVVDNPTKSYISQSSANINPSSETFEIEEVHNFFDNAQLYDPVTGTYSTQ